MISQCFADDIRLATAGEGSQVEALEADFLQDLYHIRQLKTETTHALQKVWPTTFLQNHVFFSCFRSLSFFLLYDSARHR